MLSCPAHRALVASTAAAARGGIQWLRSEVRGGLTATHHGGLQLSRGSAVAQRPTARLYVPVSLYTSIDGHPIKVEPVPAHDFVQFVIEKGL